MQSIEERWGAGVPLLCNHCRWWQAPAAFFCCHWEHQDFPSLFLPSVSDTLMLRPPEAPISLFVLPFCCRASKEQRPERQACSGTERFLCPPGTAGLWWNSHNPLQLSGERGHHSKKVFKTAVNVPWPQMVRNQKHRMPWQCGTCYHHHLGILLSIQTKDKWWHLLGTILSIACSKSQECMISWAHWDSWLSI